MARRFTYLIVSAGLLLCAGCGGIHYEHDGISHSALIVAARGRPGRGSTGSAPPMRREAVEFAQQRLKQPETIEDFGQTDVADLFAALNSRVDWNPKKPLSDLIRAAERRKAFSADAAPRPGDIVLFHNQTDRNGNRQADDWLTGCGIVTETEGETFAALVRTGRGPRLAYVTPSTPSVRTRTGRVINSFLRVPTPDDPADAEYLAGQLYAGKIDIERLLDKRH